MKNNYLSSILLCLGFYLFIHSNANAQHFIEITDGPLMGTKMETMVGWHKKYCDLKLNTEFNARFCSQRYGANLNDITSEIDLGLELDDVGVCYRGGGASYDIKAHNVNYSEGSGIIIINNQLNEPDDEMFITGTEIIPDTNFFSISLSYNSGKILENAGITAFKFKILSVEDNSSDEVIWEDGQFDGGIQSWSTVGISCGGIGQDPAEAIWIYDAEGAAYKGGSKLSSIASVTACNGAMVFNSFMYDTNGQQPGDGSCTIYQIGELISPNIDISSLPAGAPVTLTFYQSVSHGNSEYFVAWSNDGGASWQQKLINDDLEFGDFIAGKKMRVRLEGTEASPNFKVKFIYHGNYNYWIIDDVKLVKAAQFNITTNDDWMAGAPYPTVPSSMNVPITFMANVSNTGYDPMTGTILSARVFNDFGEEVHLSQNSITSPGAIQGTILPGSEINNSVFGSYTPDQIGDYIIVYKLASNEEDEDITDNTFSKSFSITTENGGQWGREDGITGNIAMKFEEDEPVDWAYSNVFRGEKSGSIVSNVTFQVANADEIAAINGTAQFFIYECTDKNGDFIYTYDEYEIVGYNFFDFPLGIMKDAQINLNILDISTQEPKDVKIREGKIYVLSLVYKAPEDSPYTDLYWACSDKNNQRVIEYIGQKNGDYVCTHEMHAPWQMNGPIDCTPQRTLFQNTPVPYARFSVWTASSNNLQLDPLSFNLFPTLTNNVINISYNIKTDKAVLLEIYDINGKLVSAEKYFARAKESKVINVGQLIHGTYIAKITTSEGSISKPFNVIR